MAEVIIKIENGVVTVFPKDMTREDYMSIAKSVLFIPSTVGLNGLNEYPDIGEEFESHMVDKCVEFLQSHNKYEKIRKVVDEQSKAVGLIHPNKAFGDFRIGK